VKTAHPYIDPTPKQVKALCSVLPEALRLPSKELAQYWINNPVVIQTLLRGLLYRPARVHSYSPQFDDELRKLVVEGLVEKSETFEKFDDSTDIVIKQCRGNEEARRRAIELAQSGVIVIADILEEEKGVFSAYRNIHEFVVGPFEPHNTYASIEWTVREVIKQHRDRFYCGPVE